MSTFLKNRSRQSSGIDAAATSGTDAIFQGHPITSFPHDRRLFARR